MTSWRVTSRRPRVLTTAATASAIRIATVAGVGR